MLLIFLTLTLFEYLYIKIAQGTIKTIQQIASHNCGSSVQTRNKKDKI